MECTNENPCGICDICTLEDEVETVISTALYKNCESNKCTGCDHCNNCHHGEEINCCEICSPPPKCAHGVVYGETEGCVKCEEEHERQMDMDADPTEYCKHDIEFSDCHECGAEMDAAAERHREQQEWLHYHPVD